MSQAFSNWSGVVRCNAAALGCPDSEDALAESVQASGRVRVVGTGHSFLPYWQDGDTVISLDALSGLIDVSVLDDDSAVARVWGGTKLWALGEPLWEAGYSMANMGDIDRQSLAGAVSTGTHGTGTSLGNISSAVRGLRLVGPDGSITEIGPSRELQAASVSLGLLGVISQVVLRVVPRYGLVERDWQADAAETMDHLEELTVANRHFEFFWLPGDDLCHSKSLNPIDPTGLDTSEAPQIPFGTSGECCGPSFRIFPSARETRFNEMEYSVPAENGPQCFLGIRELMRSRFPKVPWPVEYRTLDADALWLSSAHERESVTISIHQGADRPFDDFFRAAEQIFIEHQGRPHWGKVHYRSAEDFAALYPRWAEFLSLRAEKDPDGKFMNPYLKGIFGGEGRARRL
ncbi:MAG: FAD-binding protein [Gammaproteobacteria bacterium]|nr:FAD-binding protein [Gammaproteobacteria bacterium]